MNDQHKFSKNFSLDEFTRSETAARHGFVVTVEADSDVYRNLERLCREILQPVRDALGAVHISSGYRPERLNTLIGGSSTSQHLYGQAADLDIPGHAALDVARWIEAHAPFDQLIHEFGRWVHVSVATEGTAARGQTLTAVLVEGKTRYVPGLMTIEEAEAYLHEHDI